MAKRSFFWLFATNFFGVLNDNFLKSLAAFVALGWVGAGSAESVFMGVTAGALVLPYIVFSPLADRLAAVFEKKKILVAAKIAELPIMAVAAAGFYFKSPATVVAAVLLMGLQSSLYSPAKYALVRDVGGAERISKGMGGMEAVAFAAVLSGTVAAALAADHAPEWTYHAAFFAFALAGLAFSLSIRAPEEVSRRFHSMNPVRFFMREFRACRRIQGLNATIAALGVFWWAAATLQMGLVVYAKQVLELSAAGSAAILAAAAVGIVFGNALAGVVDTRHPLIGWCLATGLAGSAVSAILFFAAPGPVPFAILTTLLAFDLGFFKLPLDADIQKRVKGPRLNTVLAYFNQASFMFMLAASATYAAASALFGPRAFLALIAAVLFASPILFTLSHRIALVEAGRLVLGARYRVSATGDLPHEGETYLVLPNHPAMVDPMLVALQIGHLAVKPLSDEYFLSRGGVSGRVLRTFGAIPVPDLRKHASRKGAGMAKALTGIVTDALAAGESIIFYPSGHIWTEEREEIGTRQLAHNVCRALPDGVRVVLVRTSGLWGSIWSRKGRAGTVPFAPTFIKSILLWPLSFFRRRRAVDMCFEDATERVKEWAALPRLEFNRRLEEWYNNETPRS